MNLKLSKGIWILSKLRHFVSENILKNLYNAFIQPRIDYGLVLWGNALDTHLKKVAINLNKAVRIILFKDNFVSAQPLYKSLNLLNLKECVNLTQAKFMFKYTQNLHPKCIQSIFETNAQSNHHKTRQISKGNLYLPFRRTSHGQQFITLTGVKLWNNSIPHEFRPITNLHTFLKKIQTIHTSQVKSQDHVHQNLPYFTNKFPKKILAKYRQNVIRIRSMLLEVIFS